MRFLQALSVLIAAALLGGGPAPSSKTSVVAQEATARAPSIACGTIGARTHGNDTMLLFDALQKSQRVASEVFQPQMAVWKPATWAKGSALTIRFLDHPEMTQDIMKIANEWTQGLDVSFRVTTSEPADIRVSVTGGLASRIGREALSVADEEPTMHLGGLLTAADSTERRAFILHEFGHALGALHEHQRQVAKLTWNTDFVYQYYLDKYRMGRDEVNRHVIGPFMQDPAELVESKDFDPKSVMMYPVLEKFTKEGFVQPWNANITGWDRRIMESLYGK